MYLYYILSREWPQLKKAFMDFWGVNFDAPVKPVLTRWKYFFFATIQQTPRWGYLKAMCLIKTCWLDSDSEGMHVPPAQPIATIGGFHIHHSSRAGEEGAEDCTLAANTRDCIPAADAEGNALAPNAEGCTPTDTEGCTPAAATEGNAAGASAEDNALAPNTEDCTPAPNTKGCTPAAGTEGCTPAANAEDCTPAANAEDCTPAADAEGNALAAGTEDCTLRVEGSVAGACAEGSAPMANVAGGSADMQPLVKKQKIKKQSVDRKPLKMEYKFVLSEVCEQTIKHLKQAAG